jgi:hypothetical protein
MKEIIRAVLAVTPAIVILVVGAYVVEELLEDFVSETVSDFVYPVAVLSIFLLLWYRVVPSIKTHYLSESNSAVDSDETNPKNRE